MFKPNWKSASSLMVAGGGDIGDGVAGTVRAAAGAFHNKGAGAAPARKLAPRCVAGIVCWAGGGPTNCIQLRLIQLANNGVLLCGASGSCLTVSSTRKPPVLGRTNSRSSHIGEPGKNSLVRTWLIALWFGAEGLAPAAENT